MRITSRLGRVVAAAGVAALWGMVGLRGGAFAASVGGASPTSIHVIATIANESFLNPDGTAVTGAPAVGARDIFRDTLKSPEGQSMGDDGGVCTVTSLAPLAAQCLVTFSLPGGQITSQALTAPPPAPALQAITGGTGQYRDARGQVSVTFPAPHTADVVFAIISPEAGAAGAGGGATAGGASGGELGKSAAGQLAGNAGGAYAAYTISSPTGAASTLILTYGPLSGGGAGISIETFQAGGSLGHATDSGNTGTITLAIAPSATGGPVLVKVGNYTTTTISYTLTAS